MKYHRCTPSGCNGIGIITFEIMAKTQFLTKLCLIFRYLQRTIYSLETMILLKRVFKKRIGWHLIGWWEQLFYFKNTLIFFAIPPLNISRGGARKKCIILNLEKTTLPFLRKIFIFVGIHSVFLNYISRAKFFGVKIYFSSGKSQIFVFRTNFIFGRTFFK